MPDSPHGSSEPPSSPARTSSQSESESGEFAAAHDDFGLKPRPRVQRVDPLLGMDLGGITIIRLLGEGGMGRVYEARQTNPPRPVAVKVMRQGLASDKSMRRFEREAEFLARLQHPGIAQIHVVGSYSSDDGDVPFFVMEYVADAKPINTFVAAGNLALADRLNLFVSVCEAVAHGHDRGIIHRDLKPGNILIDSCGKPRVIDFGVARSTDAEPALTSMRTAAGNLVGTVQYMSPEQFGAKPDELDPRADVYSLGVVLYELLCGSLPYDMQNKGLHEIARLVCDEPPTPLRSRVKEIPPGVSAIVHKCLEKDRRKRYQSAGELADDVRRFLAGQRVHAANGNIFRASWVSRRPPRSKAGQALLGRVAGGLVIVILGFGLVRTVGGWLGGSSTTSSITDADDEDMRLMRREFDEIDANLQETKRDLDRTTASLSRDGALVTLQTGLNHALIQWQAEAEELTRDLRSADELTDELADNETEQIVENEAQRHVEVLQAMHNAAYAELRDLTTQLEAEFYKAPGNDAVGTGAASGEDVSHALRSFRVACAAQSEKLSKARFAAISSIKATAAQGRAGGNGK